MIRKTKWVCGAFLLLWMSCYPIPISPAVITAQEQEKIPWEVQMKGLIVFLEIQLVELRAQAHSELYIKQISNLGCEMGKLQADLNTYNCLNASQQTEDMRKKMASKYCELIQEVVELREKIRPPQVGGAKET